MCIHKLLRLMRLNYIASVGDPMFGLLYNWYAVNHADNLPASGWHIPTNANATTLLTTWGSIHDRGGALGIADSKYWVSYDNATNSSGFNGKGAGIRSGSTGAYSTRRVQFKCFLYDSGHATYPDEMEIYIAGGETSLSASITNNVNTSKNTNGYSVRLVKDSTILTDGQTGTYTGNDGKTYGTICISGLEWLSENLRETKYRNGNNIPLITDTTGWTSDATGARCSYNNL